MSPFRKVILVFLLSFAAFIISLPKNLPLNFELLGVKVDKKLVRPDLNLKFGKFNIQKNFNLVLGLDLAGGGHLVFEADTLDLSAEKKRQALESLKNIIERRVNLFGVSEPNVVLSSFQGKERVVVELPGVKDTKKAIDLIGKTAQLQFAEVGSQEQPSITPTDLTGADLESAQVTFDQNSGKPIVAIEFTPEGGQKFAELTKNNVGKPLAILLDDGVVSAPVVQQEITGGSAVITGNFELEEAKNLAIQLNAGALPVGISLVEQRTVGASLGAESVQRSIRAGVVGLIMVMIFMMLAYGKFGFLADVALVIFGLITLSLYKLIPVVLTLPGIAGFLLSVGMAVDSNILIFERFKEEKERRDFVNALEVSFGRAWDSIRDANIATLVTAFVLANPFEFSFLHTSGPVRGFAITLAIGIGVSLFTGVVVVRNLMRVFLKEVKND